MAKYGEGDFAKVWANRRAARPVSGESRIRTAMDRSTAGCNAEARADLEYVRDHFDCGVPYLHQMIGPIAAIQGDEPAKAAALERLREFGPEFAGPLDFSPEPMVTALTGLTMNFGMLPGLA